jgi:hypothetical protein
VVVPGLTRSLSRQLPAVAEIPDHGRVFGTSALPGSSRQLAISAADSLHHAHVLGPTGVGKSTLLARLAVGDLAAGRRPGGDRPQGRPSGAGLGPGASGSYGRRHRARPD